MPGDGPDEARQLAGDRSGDDIGRLGSPGESAIARAQPDLPLPGDVADGPRLVLLPQPQPAAEPTRVYSDEEALVCSLENPEACEACQ